jgi:hypothetical protein
MNTVFPSPIQRENWSKSHPKMIRGRNLVKEQEKMECWLSLWTHSKVTSVVYNIITEDEVKVS